MRLTSIFVVICALLSACVTRTVSVSKPVVTTSVDDSSRQRRQQQRITKRIEKPQIRESSLYFDNSQATLSLRAMIIPPAPDHRSSSGDVVFDEANREIVSSYQILIQSRNSSGLVIESVALRSPSQSFSLPTNSINSAGGTSFYVNLAGEQAASINSDENSLLVFSYQGRTISAVIVQHQLSNIIESTN